MNQLMANTRRTRVTRPTQHRRFNIVTSTPHPPEPETASTKTQKARKARRHRPDTARIFHREQEQTKLEERRAKILLERGRLLDRGFAPRVDVDYGKVVDMSGEVDELVVYGGKGSQKTGSATTPTTGVRNGKPEGGVMMKKKILDTRVMSPTSAALATIDWSDTKAPRATYAQTVAKHGGGEDDWELL